MKIFLACYFVGVGLTTVSGAAVIDTRLKRSFGDLGKRENVMVSFTQSLKPVINKINSMNFSSMAEKRRALVDAEKTFTQGSQAPLQSFLNTMGVKYESFWINNKVIIPNANFGLVQQVSGVPGVARVEPEPVAKMSKVVRASNLTRNTRQSDLTWGIKRIKADQVWQQFGRGEGIVIAGIDSGVRYTHEALKDNWRSERGWYDAYDESDLPFDDQGHGTHTAGTMVGHLGIGVAPGAKWIACRACHNVNGEPYCDGRTLFKCGQWVVCPTDTKFKNGNCNLTPDIASNSWNYNGGGGQTYFDEVLDTWHSAGVIPVFSNGNAGPDCGTTKSPADRGQVIAVGNIDIDLKIYFESSLGPTVDGKIKPDIVGPGTAVRSSLPTSDNAYDSWTGTSMACPHVSGTVALMLQKNKGLNYNQIYRALTSRTQRGNLNTRSAKFCGSTAPFMFPNNVFGYGLLDALASVRNV